MTWNRDWERRKGAWEFDKVAGTAAPEPDWVEEARELLLRAAEGGMFREVFKTWFDGGRSPLVAARASELLGRDVSAEDIKAFGVFDRRRDGWARRFWKAIDQSRLAAEREESGG